MKVWVYHDSDFSDNEEYESVCFAFYEALCLVCLEQPTSNQVVSKLYPHYINMLTKAIDESLNVPAHWPFEVEVAEEIVEREKEEFLESTEALKQLFQSSNWVKNHLAVVSDQLVALVNEKDVLDQTKKAIERLDADKLFSRIVLNHLDLFCSAQKPFANWMLEQFGPSPLAKSATAT